VKQLKRTGNKQLVVSIPAKASVFKKVNRLVYEPVRFMILEKLIAAGNVDFSYLAEALRQEINLTDGNLAGHLLKLEEARYVKAKRRFIGRRPATTYSITSAGREAFQWFLIGLAQRLLESSQATGIKIPLK